MKNNDHTEIREARTIRVHKAMPTDLLVVSRIVQENMERISQPKPPRKRRINYAKKIENDPFIMGA